jgi:hypothetical protein
MRFWKDYSSAILPCPLWPIEMRELAENLTKNLSVNDPGGNLESPAFSFVNHFATAGRANESHANKANSGVGFPFLRERVMHLMQTSACGSGLKHRS